MYYVLLWLHNNTLSMHVGLHIRKCQIDEKLEKCAWTFSFMCRRIPCLEYQVWGRISAGKINV